MSAMSAETLYDTYAKLRRDGWRVMRVWEHQLKKKSQAESLDRIADFIGVRPR